MSIAFSKLDSPVYLVSITSRKVLGTWGSRYYFITLLCLLQLAESQPSSGATVLTFRELVVDFDDFRIDQLRSTSSICGRVQSFASHRREALS